MAEDRPLSSADMIRMAREQLSQPPSKSTRPMAVELPDGVDEEVSAAIRPVAQRVPYRPEPMQQDPFDPRTPRTSTRQRRSGGNPAVSLVVAGSLFILGLALFLSFASTTGP